MIIKKGFKATNEPGDDDDTESLQTRKRKSQELKQKRKLNTAKGVNNNTSQDEEVTKNKVEQK